MDQINSCLELDWMRKGRRLALLMLLVGMVIGLGGMVRGVVSAEIPPLHQTTPVTALGGNNLVIQSPFSATYGTENIGTPNNLNVAGSVAIDPNQPDKLYFGSNNFSGASGELYM